MAMCWSLSEIWTKLDAMREGVMDLGMTEWPPTEPQAMRTWAGVAPIL